MVRQNRREDERPLDRPLPVCGPLSEVHEHEDGPDAPQEQGREDRAGDPAPPVIIRGARCRLVTTPGSEIIEGTGPSGPSSPFTRPTPAPAARVSAIAIPAGAPSRCGEAISPTIAARNAICDPTEISISP